MNGKFESTAARAAAIREDLIAARETLHAKLRTNTVKHICFPWAIAGNVAEEIASEVGYESAYADTLGGLHAAVRGGNPYRIMRLKHQFIFSLPGRGAQIVVEYIWKTLRSPWRLFEIQSRCRNGELRIGRTRKASDLCRRWGICMLDICR
ncbi:MAG: hypothetical protein M5U15_14645 [Kiritimatiellae bacterium]|nr:hypothetical protein [Kiritimatiellia bacterium]